MVYPDSFLSAASPPGRWPNPGQTKSPASHHGCPGPSASPRCPPTHPPTPHSSPSRRPAVIPPPTPETCGCFHPTTVGRALRWHRYLALPNTPLAHEPGSPVPRAVQRSFPARGRCRRCCAAWPFPPTARGGCEESRGLERGFAPDAMYHPRPSPAFLPAKGYARVNILPHPADITAVAASRY